MEIDSILEIILEFCKLYYVKLETLSREIDIFLPSFFFVLEEGVIIYMEIDSILKILKLYLEKLAFSSLLSFLSSMIICMEIDSILEIILESCILYYVEFKTLPWKIGIFLPSFFFILEKRVSWLFVWRSIRSWKF